MPAKTVDMIDPHTTEGWVIDGGRGTVSTADATSVCSTHTATRASIVKKRPHVALGSRQWIDS